MKKIICTLIMLAVLLVITTDSWADTCTLQVMLGGVNRACDCQEPGLCVGLIGVPTICSCGGSCECGECKPDGTVHKWVAYMADYDCRGTCPSTVYECEYFTTTIYWQWAYVPRCVCK